MKMGLRKKGLGGALLAAGLLTTGSALAGATIKMDDTKWLSVGAGIRSSFAAQENATGNGDQWSTSFALDNVRLYVNGQVHENIKFEFNTECGNCGGNSGGATDIFVLDAIAKFEFSDLINIWTGRLLVPSDRAELDGPFYQNTYEFNRTPFFPNDQFNQAAGRYGRDDGVVLWGALTADKRLTYSVGVFDGNSLSTVNGDDTLLYAGRVSYNFLNVEQNPGYYTSSTYYGNAGDIFTIAAATQYQEDGVGNADNPADFWGMSVDVLYETVLGSGGVVTAEAQWKRFELTGYVADAVGADTNNIFEGNAYTGTLLYLMPGEMGIGRLQPYVRYTNNNTDSGVNQQEEFEGGLNYIIDGHNAKVSLWYQYGDINTAGRSYLTDASGDHVSSIKMAVQLQL